MNPTLSKTDTLEILSSFIRLSSTEQNTQMLDDWAENIIAENKYGFQDGLLGLGWLIAYLIETKHIEADADEILEDIDDTLYKLTIREVMLEHTDVDNLLRYITYYQQRLQYKSKAHFYRRFTHFECIKLLIQKLNAFLDAHIANMSKDIRNLSNILLKYSYLTKTCIPETLIEKPFYETMEELIEYFEKHESNGSNKEALAKLLICSKQYEHTHWADRIRAIVTRNDFYLNNADTSVKLWYEIAMDYPKQEISLEDFMIDTGSDKKQLFEYITNVKQEITNI